MGPNSKTRWRRWNQIQKEDGVVVEKQDGVVCRDDIKEVVCRFRLVEVGILSGCSILLKRTDLRYPPRPASADRAAVWTGKAMGFIEPRGQKPWNKTKKKDGVAGLKLKNKMAPENKIAPGFRLEVCILSVEYIIKKDRPVKYVFCRVEYIIEKDGCKKRCGLKLSSTPSLRPGAVVWVCVGVLIERIGLRWRCK